MSFSKQSTNVPGNIQLAKVLEHDIMSETPRKRRRKQRKSWFVEEPKPELLVKRKQSTFVRIEMDPKKYPFDMLKRQD